MSWMDISAQYLDGACACSVAAATDASADRDAPHDFGSRRLPRGVRRGWLDFLLVHWEGNNNLHRTLQCVKTLSKRVGVVINPATPATVLEEILPDVDQVLVMTVDPGFGHQHFLNTTLAKIRRVREMVDRIKPGATWRWMEGSMR
jgi:pentose-5-phosphate-3-epimerase